MLRERQRPHGRRGSAAHGSTTERTRGCLVPVAGRRLGTQRHLQSSGSSAVGPGALKTLFPPYSLLLGGSLNK